MFGCFGVTCKAQVSHEETSTSTCIVLFLTLKKWPDSNMFPRGQTSIISLSMWTHQAWASSLELRLCDLHEEFVYVAMSVLWVTRQKLLAQYLPSWRRVFILSGVVVELSRIVSPLHMWPLLADHAHLLLGRQYSGLAPWVASWKLVRHLACLMSFRKHFKSYQSINYRLRCNALLVDPR